MHDELDELARRASASGGRLGLAVHDLGTGERAEVDAGRVFTAASVIKLPIMMTLLSGTEAGTWSLDDRLPLAPSRRVGGAGVAAELADVPDLSVRDLLTLMIIVSDNMATNLLIDLLGMDAVTSWCARHGMPRTVLARSMMDADARARGHENRTTPADTAALLTGLARGDLLGERATAHALEVLTRQQTADRLPRHLPGGVRLAHKTGELDGVRHDAGIVLADGRAPIVIVVLTEGFADEDHAADLVAEAGRVVYTVL
ncbi:hypothetical protein BJF79_05105 [Actinomadura sp. CNU-125]|uniref:serine hydrolase n=1 Tax=Actinomadura sp. CNU-125 TaxID=1904961 RepID=UPI00095BD651|nr:serine hydrolase [Actinomadura sp. CNU-125]OLT10101.1 hypothetical protein BJF79_05105 [Actinomadura sp. CNU-125]